MELLRAFDIAIKQLGKSIKSEDQEAARVLDGFRSAVVKTRRKKVHVVPSEPLAPESTTNNQTTG
jgi:hypothetical protein